MGCHIKFFLKISIQEGIFNINLRDMSQKNRSYYNKSMNNIYFCNKSKCLIIIHTILFRVFFCNQPNFVSLNRFIRISLILYTQQQLTTLLLGGRGTKSQESICFMQNRKFLIHSLLLKRIKNCLFRGRRL